MAAAIMACTVVGCSSLLTPVERDPMCHAIAVFADTTPRGEVHRVELRGGWGGEEKDTIMTHDCEHGGFGPAKVLCEYLVPNTSWEFGSSNAEPAFRCLARPARDNALAQLKKEAEVVEAVAPLRGRNAASRMVTIYFNASDDHQLSLLRIEVEQ
jgi:hypothetical protein